MDFQISYHLNVFNLCRNLNPEVLLGLSRRKEGIWFESIVGRDSLALRQLSRIKESRVPSHSYPQNFSNQIQYFTVIA